MVIVKYGHWVPNAWNACLLSTGALCEHGCKYTLDERQSHGLFLLVNSYLKVHFNVEPTLYHMKLRKLHLSLLLLAPSTSGIVH